MYSARFFKLNNMYHIVDGFITEYTIYVTRLMRKEKYNYFNDCEYQPYRYIFSVG